MSVLFRQFLLQLRKLRAKHKNIRFLFYFLGLVFAVISYILEPKLPVELSYNIIRAAFALVISILWFSGSYLSAIIYSEKRSLEAGEGILYLTVRERFTYTQRKNMSLVIGVAAFVINFLVFKPKMPIYVTGVSLFLWLMWVLFAFVRSTRDEHRRAMKGLDDIRDYPEKYQAILEQREKISKEIDEEIKERSNNPKKDDGDNE